jgi:hypothetical protein
MLPTIRTAQPARRPGSCDNATASPPRNTRSWAVQLCRRHGPVRAVIASGDQDVAVASKVAVCRARALDIDPFG